jgi:SAM-dependent methyltransferase
MVLICTLEATIIAPPAVALMPVEEPEALTRWRIGRWPLDEHGWLARKPDSDAVADVVATAEVLARLGEPHHAWVQDIMRLQLAQHEAFATPQAGGLSDEERSRRSRQRLLGLRDELRAAFPDQDWYEGRQDDIPPVPDTDAGLLAAIDGARPLPTDADPLPVPVSGRSGWGKSCLRHLSCDHLVLAWSEYLDAERAGRVAPVTSQCFNVVARQNSDPPASRHLLPRVLSGDTTSHPVTQALLSQVLRASTVVTANGQMKTDTAFASSLDSSQDPALHETRRVIEQRIARCNTTILLLLVAAVCARVVLALVHVEPESMVPNEVVLTTLLVSVAYAVIERSRLRWLCSVMRPVGKFSYVAQEPSREFLLSLATARTEQTVAVLRGLARGTHSVESPELMAEWFDAFFSQGGASYKAVDSHVPGDYLSQYDWYLTVHEEALTRRSSNVLADTRILVATGNELTEDYLRTPEHYLSFYEWHRRNRVAARWVDQRHAEQLRQKYGLHEADVGLWEHYAVLFTPNRTGAGVTLSMVFAGEGEQNGMSYARVWSFVNEMEEIANPLADSPPGIDLVDEELAREWEYYVDATYRCDPNGPVGQFLLDALDGRRYVLDAAAGVGCDSVLLLSTGRFTVQTNEIDARLAAVARRFADAHQIPIHLSNHPWDRLTDTERDGNKAFDAILCLGNSLCLVQDKRRRDECLTSFHNMLVPGGILIIDERNFEYLLHNREAILEDPLKNFRPTHAGDVMYRGLRVRGYPSEISPESVVWRFFRNEPPVASMAELHEREVANPGLALHPFRHGELHQALRGAGFSQIETYADLHKISDANGEMPTRSQVADASFLTYIAQKGPAD